MISAVVVDDEPPARARLRELLADHADVAVVAEAGDVRTAAAMVIQYRPDVVFLDIQLPDDDGFGVVDLIGRGAARPAVVVTTAHADYAVRAFDVGALDYLLKPFARDRLAVAVNRVRDQLAGGAANPGIQSAPISRIPVMSGGKVRFVDVSRVEIIRADRNYVRIHAGVRPLLVRSTLHEIEQRLPREHFCRVSRSAIVRLDRVVEVETLPHGELALWLASGEQVISGRGYSSALRASLGMEGSATDEFGGTTRSLTQRNQPREKGTT
jgi:two-component system, LytTR family, response regulator